MPCAKKLILHSLYVYVVQSNGLIEEPSYSRHFIQKRFEDDSEFMCLVVIENKTPQLVPNPNYLVQHDSCFNTGLSQSGLIYNLTIRIGSVHAGDKSRIEFGFEPSC